MRPGVQHSIIQRLSSSIISIPPAIGPPGSHANPMLGPGRPNEDARQTPGQGGRVLPARARAPRRAAEHLQDERRRGVVGGRRGGRAAGREPASLAGQRGAAAAAAHGRGAEDARGRGGARAAGPRQRRDRGARPDGPRPPARQRAERRERLVGGGGPAGAAAEGQAGGWHLGGPCALDRRHWRPHHGYSLSIAICVPTCHDTLSLRARFLFSGSASGSSAVQAVCAACHIQHVLDSHETILSAPIR